LAILWQQRVGATLYQVRTAGNTRRLYSNGVLHSQYNEARPVTGNVWDLLLLPAFLAAPGTVRRVLLLGVGGGAVIRQLQHFLQPERIVGVELNPVHLRVARRFFGVHGPGVELHRAEARQWLSRYAGPPFDLVIEDLFADQDGQPVRAIAADADWMALLDKVLAPAGMLVMNFPSLAELRAGAAQRDVRRHVSVLRLSTPQNDNAVGVFLPRTLKNGELQRRLCALPELDMRRPGCRLRYRLQRL
jgi:spermidine synthase